VIETHIEKRARAASIAEEDNIDHDKVVAVLLLMMLTATYFGTYTQLHRGLPLFSSFGQLILLYSYFG